MRRLDPSLNGGSTAYIDGNPTTGAGGTVPQAEPLNHIQEELCYLVEQAGITLDSPSGNKTQVRAAVLAMIAANVPQLYLGGTTLAGSNYSLTGGATTAPDLFAVKFVAANPASATLTIGATAYTLVDQDGPALPAGNLSAGDTRVLVKDGTTLKVQAADDVLNAEEVAQVNALIAAALASIQGVPTGTTAHFAMNAAPSGWLAANGAAVSRTTYAALFTAIGTTFGVGDGTTTFNIPDLRGEFVRGWDNGRGVDSGRAFGSLQLDAMQGHKHLQLGSFVYQGGNGTYGANSDTTSIGQTGTPITDGSNGTPRTASETRPRNIALLACIKY